MSRQDQWLNGQLLYLKPEHRGQGLIRRLYFPAALGLARASGLKGFRFLSTLERWKSVTFLHQERFMQQETGPEVWAFWKGAQ